MASFNSWSVSEFTVAKPVILRFSPSITEESHGELYELLMEALTDHFAGDTTPLP